VARIRSLLIGGVIGAAAVYLFDPDLGQARRARLREALAGLVHDAGWPIVDRLLGAVPDDAPTQRADDDLMVLNRVESVLLGTPDFPRGSIDIELVDGACVLRGEVSSDEQGRRIAETAASVPGVRAVESLLHTAT
jgi:hypothetical protein